MITQRAIQYFIVLGICLHYWLMPAQAIGATLPQLTKADFILSAAELPPAESAAWQMVTMPDDWSSSHPKVYGTAWYRFHFNFNKQNEKEIHAVYIARLCMNVEVFVNGVKIGDGGSFKEPVGRNWNRPLLFIVPPHLLHEGRNELHIRLLAPQNSQASLFPPVFDTLKNIQPHYDRAYFVRITMNQTASLLIAAMSLLMLSLWVRRKQDTAYGLFGLAAMVWALQSINLYVTTAPLNTALWELLVNSSFQAVAALLFISLLRFIKTDWKLLRWGLWGILIFAPLSLAVVPESLFIEVTSFWHLASVSATAATLFHLIRTAIFQRNKDARLLLFALGFVLLLAFHDWVLHAKPEWFKHAIIWSGEEFLLQFAAPVLFFFVGWVMTTRYVRTLNNFEALNDQLEQRVAEKHQELDQNFAQIQSMLKEQAMLEERERIYEDLHDDVGAKLLTLVYRAQTPNNAEIARSALQDLRDVVSYTGTEKIELVDAMADFRVECEQRLSDVGISLRWLNEMADSRLQLTQPQALNWGRILREATSNIIRHAQAQQVEVSLKVVDDKMLLEISDDGIGLIEKESPASGRGLANIRKRTSLLNAELAFINRVPRGLSLQIKIPLAELSLAEMR